MMRFLFLLVGLCLGGASLAQSPATIAVAGTVVVGASGSGRTNGSGREVDEVRPLQPFSAIRVNGPIDVVLKASQREQVTVRFDDNLLASIETRVVADASPTLEIRIDPAASFRSSSTPKVIVEFKAINALATRGSGDVHADLLRGATLAIASAGSGDIRVDRIEVDVLGVSLSGSGDFSAAGRARQQGFSVAGSGDVQAGDLVGQTVKVRVAGSGDVHVHAEELLDAAVAGSGDVIYSGNPVIRKSVAGSGEVRKAR
jgi:hypothetical protein